MLLTPDEIADALRCPRAWVDLLLKGRFLPCTPGRMPYVPERALAKFMRARAGAAGPEADLMRLYDREGAAARMGVTIDELSRRNRNGHIGYVPLRPVLYREADILNFMDSEARRAKEAEQQARHKANCKATAALLRGLPKIPLHLRPRIAKLPPIKNDRSDSVLASKRGQSADFPALKQQKNGVWYLQWLEGRCSRSRSTRTKDGDQALKIQREWKRARRNQPLMLFAAPEQRPPPNADLRLGRHGCWYLHWSEGTRSMSLSTRTKDQVKATHIREAWSAGRRVSQPKMSDSI